MKKVVILLCLFMMLAGCDTITLDQDNYTESLNAIIESAKALELPSSTENNAQKDYYTYYLPTGVGSQEKDETSNIFSIYGNEAILNLDIAGVLVNTYYDDASSEEVSATSLRDVERFNEISFENSGTFENSSGEIIAYRVYVSEVDEDLNYIIVQTNDFLFVTTCYVTQVDEMIFEMIKILRTCTCDRELVIENYSNVSEQASSTSVISLFKEILPESGSVSDYIENWKEDSDFQLIDNHEEDDTEENYEEYLEETDDSEEDTSDNLESSEDDSEEDTSDNLDTSEEDSTDSQDDSEEVSE